MIQSQFYDTHAHLDFPEFAGELEELVKRAELAGISRIITIGTTLTGSQAAVSIAEKYPSVFAAVGWHPSSVMAAPADLPEEYRRLAKHPKVVAIGETGLDFSRLPSKNSGTLDEDECYKDRQKKLFAQQLELAAENHLNVIVHQRDAFDDTAEALKPWSTKLRAVFHCFVGTVGEQRVIHALGSIVSFTGIVTFKNAQEVRLTARATPLGSFMLETDCPYLAPVPFRGKRCEPSFVAATAEFLAREKRCTLEELSHATCRTAHEFFPKLQRG